jgi:predicted DNA binding CopG/RHH family protein
MHKANTETIDLPLGNPVPDDRIDTTDIPETTAWTGAVRGLFARPETRHVSIRLNAADLVLASELAAAKGLPYQTCIKSLLH